MIQIKNLNVHYGNSNIINNLSLNIEKGKFTSIIGPNGCGKSTIIKSIAGLIPCNKNSITIDNKLRTAYKRKEFSKKIAFLMQFGTSCTGITVRELVSYGRHPYTSGFFNKKNEEDESIIDWAIKKTNLKNYENKFLELLSGGEKQRAYLAMALAQQPEILILDEPTNHLDIKYQYEILNLVRQLNLEQEVTVVCVLHDINQASKYSDNIVVVKNGTLIKSGTPKQCITKDLMHKVYDIKCEVNKRNNTYCVDVI